MSPYSPAGRQSAAGRIACCPASISAPTIVLLDEWLGSAARERPAHPALVTGGQTLSYAELEERSARAARRLAALGVRAGDRVATTLPAGVAFVELLHAAAKLGAVLMPLDPRQALARADVLVDGPLHGHEVDVELRYRVDPEAVHSLLHTSGTTGSPRPVELTYANHHASALASASAIGVDPVDRWLCPLPLFHVGGLAILLRSVINRTTVVLHERFEAERLKSALERGQITLVSLVPTMLHRLRESGFQRAPRLRAALLGGAPIPPELLRWAADRELPVVPVYGMTETASLIAAGSPARPLPGAELRIGAGGEILVRGPMVARSALADDGWLHTGDRGSIDAEGRLRVDGRIKELIVTGGENVSPVEVEQALASHPAVAEAAVAGLPDPEWGEAVTAFVVLAGRATTDGLTAYLRERLPAHKVPKRIEFVSALPRSPLGKLRRELLAPARRGGPSPGARRAPQDGP